MQKVDLTPDYCEPATEQPADPIAQPARRPVTPLEPMTDEEHEALREIIAMMDIRREDISEERLKELCGLWE